MFTKQLPLRRKEQAHAQRSKKDHQRESAPLTADGAMLQRMIGNQSIKRLSPIATAHSGLLQREENNRHPRNSVPDKQEQAPTQPSPNQEGLESRLDEIEARYRRMIAGARANGWAQAAQNLEHFLDGNGSPRTLPVNWLRSFQSILNAERVNEARFHSTLNSNGESLNAIASRLANNTERRFQDHWAKQVGYEYGTELFFASGDSTLTSRGSFTLSRSDTGAWGSDTIIITGNVVHEWHDPYDWHAGLSADVPGFGSISDDDALLLKTHRGAKEFNMNARWTRSVLGYYNLSTGKSNYAFTGP